MRIHCLLMFVVTVAALPAGSQRNLPASSGAANAGWVLTWSDEFNRSSTAAPDPTRWVVETGGHGWGNRELQSYTARRENLREEQGLLVIEAIHEKFTGSDGIRRDYTSGRLKTQARFSQKYGRFEARIKVPSGRGVWPAFWLLGDDFSTVGWPRCGEIDIMENIGSQSSTVLGSLHGPGYSGDHAITTAYALPAGNLHDDFRVFAVEWDPHVIRFYMDGQLYASKTPADLPSNGRWVYDHPFFIILNLAIGGTLGGNPDNSLFPQKMLVDYVRVYSRR